MIVTIFRNRLRAEHQSEYSETANQMSALATTMLGYRSHKTFTAEDGERVTIVEFADAASQRAWAEQSEHVRAQKNGRAQYYAAYQLQVCEVIRSSTFVHQAEKA